MIFKNTIISDIEITAIQLQIVQSVDEAFSINIVDKGYYKTVILKLYFHFISFKNVGYETSTHNKIIILLVKSLQDT